MEAAKAEVDSLTNTPAGLGRSRDPMRAARRSAHIGGMEKILSQHRWDRLPVNTFARLYHYVDGRELILHAARVAGSGRVQMSETVLLGETEWRDAFNEADVAFAVYVPAWKHLTIGDTIRSLRRMVPWADVEIAFGNRRYSPHTLQPGAGTAVLSLQPIEHFQRPVTARDVVALLSSPAVHDGGGTLYPTDGTRLSVMLDSVELVVTEVRQEGESAVITATLPGDCAEPMAQLVG